MVRVWLCLCLAALCPAIALAADAKPVIVPPDWEFRPSAEDLEKYYPDLAVRLGLSGRVRVTCEVAVDHTLTKCLVVEEAPAGLGFGAAALQMVKLFRMRPETRDGQPVLGAKVTVPVPFSIHPDGQDSVGNGTKAEIIPDLVKPVDPTAKALAVRIVEASSNNRSASQALRGYFAAALRNSLDEEGFDEKTVADLSLSVNSATQNVLGTLQDQRAELVTRLLTLDELKQAASFFESDAGKDFVKAQYSTAASTNYNQALDMVREQVVTAFCANHPCPPQTKPR